MTYLTRRQAQAIAESVLAGFNRHYVLFRSISAKAKELFELAQWLEIQKLVADRIRMYDDRVLETVEKLRLEFVPSTLNEVLWKDVKLAYSVLLINHKQPELAETFFNSVSNKILAKDYFNNDLIFLKPTISTEYIDSEVVAIKYFYPQEGGLRQLIQSILLYFDWKVPFKNIKQDVENIFQKGKQFLLENWVSDELNLHIRVLHSPFYRNKCTYIFGEIINGNDKYPFAISVVNRERKLAVDAALFDTKQIAVLFSFSRAYFLVEMAVPSTYVNFLKGLLPMRDKSDFYTMLGLQKQSKNIFFREFNAHLRSSSDLFILAPGIKGMVMVVFTLPSFPYVFKVIRDYFGPNKNFDQNYVRKKYELVKKHDRVGRLADTLEYTNVAIPASRCDEEMFNELKELAPSKIELRKDLLIIKHVYVERRLKPLNLVMKTATPEERESLIIEYGDTLKDLATANIFPGDMLYKNFGVTRYKKLIFYDYDEIEYMTHCHFKKIPAAPNPEYELSDEVWYPVEPGDVFPEEFGTFLLNEPDLRKVFLQHHAELLTTEFWQKKKDNILAGIVEDFYPYPESERFKSEPASSCVNKSGSSFHE
ncbi:MAG: bifunctional isocitrate dehydrogenase kinase/phosphatase [Neisseriaceae bacterium]